MDQNPSLPKVFTPFLRRFADEKALEAEELRALYDRVRARAKKRDPTDVAWVLLSKHWDRIPQDLRPAFLDCTLGILEHEKPIFDIPEANLATLSLREAVDLRRFLYSKQWFIEHEDEVLDHLLWAVDAIYEPLVKELPQTSVPSPFTIPLFHTLQQPKQFIDWVIGVLRNDSLRDRSLFVDLFRTLYLNLCKASGISKPEEPNKPFKMPSENDAPLYDVIKTYLAGTPLLRLLETPVPLRLTLQEMYGHTHIVGGTGAGKTQLLQSLILHFLESDDPPAMVIVDSQGDLIDKLSHLDLPGLRERLILVSPKDIKHPPALNIFAMNDRIDSYDEMLKEQVVAGVIDTFDYLFTGLLGADLSAKQGVFFRYVARLLLSLPETMGRNATILDMIELMESTAPYQKAIESLPPIPRKFFEKDFPSKTFTQTKEQIRYRLQAIIENPTIARLFTSPETKLDIFAELNRGSIILVDTAKDFLKGTSDNFGRIFIALTLQAILERAAVPEEKRKPTLLMIDEASSYFDENIDDILTQVRKYKAGLVLAHQYLDQASSSLRASIAANTAIKMAAGVSTNDARQLAPDLRTTPDFILGQPKLTFACHIRNVTPSAVSIPIEAGKLEARPRLSSYEYEAFLAENRARVSLASRARILIPESAIPCDDRAPTKEW